MIHNILKWWETAIISFCKLSAYRWNFILTILAPSFVFFFVKYNLWASIYESHPGGAINGYSFQTMMNYHVWALVVSLVGQGHMGIDLALEIRHGKISSYLIYPFNFWEFHTASFLSFETVQLAIALTTLTLLSLLQVVTLPTLSLLCAGFAYCLLVGLFWFSLQFLTGILAFWLEETWVLRVLLQLITTFLSGAVLPLEFFPSWLISLLDYTPFPFMVYYPVQIFLGNQIPWIKGIVVLSSWIMLSVFVNSLVWRKGLRNYTAAGM